jgi:hypothetical protein
MQTDAPITEPKIVLSDLPLHVCECGSEIFQQVLNLRKVSAILSGTGKEEVIPVGVIACVKCDKKYEASKILTPA